MHVKQLYMSCKIANKWHVYLPARLRLISWLNRSCSIFPTMSLSLFLVYPYIFLSRFIKLRDSLRFVLLDLRNLPWTLAYTMSFVTCLNSRFNVGKAAFTYDICNVGVKWWVVKQDTVNGNTLPCHHILYVKVLTLQVTPSPLRRVPRVTDVDQHFLLTLFFSF